MSRGQEFQKRKNYIEKTISELLSVKKDFGYILYARTSITDSEYVRIGDITGKAVTLNVTAMSLESIMEDIARIVLLPKEKVSVPSSIVFDKEELRKASLLFK